MRIYKCSFINDLQNEFSFRNKGDKPCSSSDHCLGPGLQDFMERFVVKETFLPGILVILIHETVQLVYFKRLVQDIRFSIIRSIQPLMITTKKFSPQLPMKNRYVALPGFCRPFNIHLGSQGQTLPLYLQGPPSPGWVMENQTSPVKS